MKKHLFLFFFALITVSAWGQRLDRLPPASEIDKAYRAEYRATLRAYERKAEQLRNEGYDIVLDDVEQVPTAISTASASGQRNWGETLLIPADVRARIAAECKLPVVIKIADTGGKQTHNDLIFGQLPGKSYTGEPSLEDGNGHGTHCAGIIAAKDVGLAWDLVKAMRLKYKPLKVLSDAGGGSFTWVANCIASERAEDKQYIAGGTAVIYSGSFGGGTAIVPAVEKEIEESTRAGVIFVFAAGNSNGGAVNYPGSSPHVLTCASLDQSLVPSSFSSKGPQVDNAMPGRNINSTYKDGTYATLSGTSMATPFLSAACAIALSKWGMAKLPSTEAMKTYLRKVATDIPPPGKDDQTGWGVVFIRAILDTEPTGGTPPPPPPPADPPTKVQAATVVQDGYVIRYRFAGDQADRVLQIRSISMFTDGATAEASIDQAREYCRAFFPSHQIVEIPKAEGLLGAGYWAGQFFEYWGKNNGKPLQVDTLTAVDEQGRAFIVSGFDRAELPQSYDGTGVKIISLQN